MITTLHYLPGANPELALKVQTAKRGSDEPPKEVVFKGLPLKYDAETESYVYRATSEVGEIPEPMLDWSLQRIRLFKPNVPADKTAAKAGLYEHRDAHHEYVAMVDVSLSSAGVTVYHFTVEALPARAIQSVNAYMRALRRGEHQPVDPAEPIDRGVWLPEADCKELLESSAEMLREVAGSKDQNIKVSRFHSALTGILVPRVQSLVSE